VNAGADNVLACLETLGRSSQASLGVGRAPTTRMLVDIVRGYRRREDRCRNQTSLRTARAGAGAAYCQHIYEFL
jgi:hypothetical protein